MLSDRVATVRRSLGKGFERYRLGYNNNPKKREL